jgi:membrane protein
MLKSVLRLEEFLFVRSLAVTAPWGPVIRFLRYPAALLRDWFSGEISLRAVSLAYTTLLSLVPMLAFTLAILKFIGARANLSVVLFQFLKPLGVAAARELTDGVMQIVQNLRGDVLGTIGFASLAYTAVATIRKVEASFHFIWTVQRPRTLARRCAEYLIALIAGPLLIAAGLTVLASSRGNVVARWSRAILPLDWTLSLLGQLLPYAIVTLAFTALYAVVPNTRVRLRAAVIGGSSAGIAWGVVGSLFATFIAYSSGTLAIYTGFAIVLTTLVWIYISWLIILFGALLSFYVQHPHYLRHGQAPVELSSVAREEAGLSMLILMGREPAAAQGGWTAERFAAELEVPTGAVRPVLDCLAAADILRLDEQGRATLTGVPEGIALGDIVAVLRRAPSSRFGVIVRALPASREVLARMDAGVRASLEGRSLRDLIARDGTSLPGDRHLVEQD